MANCKTNCCSTNEQHTKHKGHQHEHDHDHEHSHDSNNYGVIFSFVLFGIGILLQYVIKPEWFLKDGPARLILYLLAYIPIAFPVLKNAWKLLIKKDFFNEFSLMGIATIGAFLIKEYPEGVAVMLFYTIGELFQEKAVNKARGDIKSLLDVRPNSAFVHRNENFIEVAPETIELGETIRVKVGEKVPLDGELLSKKGSFNTSALTGESKPATYEKGEVVLAGMLNLEGVIEIKTTKKFEDSSIAKILELVQEASSRKAKTELYIRKFAKVYTPIVFFLAIAITFIPAIFVTDYIFQEWVYKGLVFLVISVPLGFFGGIGAASRNGILFKGSNYLEQMSDVNTVVMDKTGTLTQGTFKVSEIKTNNIDKIEFLNLVSAIEEQSTHPIAKAIIEYHPSVLVAENISEIAGKGLKGYINNQEILVGNGKLLKDVNILYPPEVDNIVESIILVAIDHEYKGYITVADELKPDAIIAIKEMKKIGVKHTVILSGDKDSITQKIAKEIGVDEAYGGLLPEGKVEKMKILNTNTNKVIAFVGDGINDAPVLALSDVGIAMGGLGSDVAIETADVVIQTDQPSKIATAIQIGKSTRKIVIQNITLALTIKIIVLILGAFGLSSLWEAVIADVGVALIAILNAVRIQQMKF